MQGIRSSFFTYQTKFNPRVYYKILIVILSFSLFSCGGGSSGDLPDTAAPDKKAPVIKSLKPLPGSSIVNANAFVDIEFDEKLELYDTNNILINYYQSTDTSSPTGAVELTSSDLSFIQNTLRIKPGLLLSNTKYQVIAKGFQDISGNFMIDQCLWEFATSPYSGSISKDITGNCGVTPVSPVTTASLTSGVFNSSQSVILTCIDTNGENCIAIYYTLDGTTPTTNSPTYSNPISIDSLNTTTILNYFGVDSAGNVEFQQTQNYTIDTILPITTVDVASGIYSGAQSVTLSCTDSSSGQCASIYYTLDGTDPTINSSVYTSPINIDLLNVTTLLKYFSVDSADNIENLQTQTYILDATTPKTTANPVGGDYNGALSVVLSCTDSGGGICSTTYFTLDGSVPSINSQVYSNSITISAANKTTILRYYSTDSAGNTESVGSQSYTITTTLPITTASVTSGIYNSALSIELTCIDARTINCTSIYYTLNGTTPTTNSSVYSAPFSISALNTTIILKYFGIDSIGNSEIVQTQSYSLDAISPVTSSSHTDGFYNAAQLVTLSCSDSGGGSCSKTYYTVNGSIPTVNSTVYTVPININTLNNSTTLRYFSVDSAGNSEPSKSNTYLIDTLPPTTTASQTAGTYPGPITVSLTCSDLFTSSLCKVTYYTIDGTTPSTTSLVYSGPISITANTTLRYFSVDNVNNSESTLNNSNYYTISFLALGSSGGPYGGGITSLKVAPVNSNVYASGIWGGMYKSNIVNNSPNWFSIGFPDNQITWFDFDRANPQSIYVIANRTVVSPLGGLYKSTDGGASWKLLYNANSGNVKVDPIDSNIIYYSAGSSDGFLRSVDGGTTFTPIGFIGAFVGAISIDSASTIMYIDTSVGIYKSSNKGDTWTQIPASNFTDTYFSDIDVDPGNANIVYVLSETKIYKSSDAGVTWSVIRTARPTDLIIDPTNSNILFVGDVNSRSISKSTDGGISWTTAYYGDFGFRASELAYDPSNSTIIYAATNSTGVYRSIDSGATWSPWNSGLLAVANYSLGQGSVAPQTLFASSGSTGVFQTSDGGANWSEFGSYNTTYSSNSAYISSSSDISVDPNNQNNIFISNWQSGVHHTIDGGTTWTTEEFDTPSVGTYSFSVIFDNKNIDVLYADVLKSSVGRLIYKSVNNGLNWFNSSTGLPSTLTGELVIDPINTNVLYIANYGNLTTASIYKSINAGSSWISLTKSFYGIESIEINPSNTNELYVGTFDSILKSTDGGATWVKVFPKLGVRGFRVYDIEVSPINNNIVYAGTQITGLFRSNNAGKDWSPINVSNMNINTIMEIKIDYINDNIIYAATRGGSVWKVEITP